MNGITVTINDRTKAATCRETVALCAKYRVTVSPALEGNGFLVLHRRHVGHGAPDGRQVFIGGDKVVDSVNKWDMNEVYAVVNLTTETAEDGTKTTGGELDLRYKNICQDFIEKHGAGANAPLVFAIYDTDGGGLAGEGEFDVKVVEPYYISEDQDLTMFVGPRGSSVTGVRLVGVDGSGNYVYEFQFSDGTRHNLTCPRGPTGLSSNGMYALNKTTGKYHVVNVTTNSLGQLSLKVDPDALDELPADTSYVTLNDVQSITGAKTFLAKIVANGGVEGNVVGDVTGDVTGNVTGGLDARNGESQALVKKQARGDNSEKAASTSFVHDALIGVGNEPLFTMRSFSEDMRTQTGGIWVPLPTQNRMYGLTGSTFLSKTDFPEAYAKLLEKFNDASLHRTSTSHKIYYGYSYRNADELDYENFSDATEPCIGLGSGQMLRTDNAFAQVSNDQYFEFVIRFKTQYPSRATGLLSVKERWHVNGEQYVNIGYIMQYTQDTLYTAAEYTKEVLGVEDGDPMIGKLPRYFGVHVNVKNSYFEVYGSSNGTSWDVFNTTNLKHSKGNLTANTWYTAHIGRDVSGWFFELRDGNDENSGGIKRLGSASSMPNMDAEIVIGNSVYAGNYNIQCSAISLKTLKQFINGSTTPYYTAENNATTSTTRFFSYTKRQQIVTNMSPSSYNFTLDQTREGFYLPVYRYRYNRDSNIDEIIHMRLKQ